MHRPAALILVALTAVACHNAPRGGVDQPGAATPQLAVQNFLAAAKAQNLQSLALAWGTDKGPARDVVDKSQIERRELIMMCYLNHDTYRIRGEGPGQLGRRTYTVDLNRSGMVRTTTLTTVHKLDEAGVRAILDLPEDVQTWAMIPVGYPTGKWGEAKRRPIREITYWDTWKQPPPI